MQISNWSDIIYINFQALKLLQKNIFFRPGCYFGSYNEQELLK